MKRTIGALLVLLALLASGCDDSKVTNPLALGEPPSARPMLLSLVPSASTITVSEELSVAIDIRHAADVGSVAFHLRYDTSVLRIIVPATEGPFMGEDGSQTIFLASDTGGGGEIVTGLSRLGAPVGASGTGTLATFRFQALAPGPCGFALSGVSVKDPQARPLHVVTRTEQVTVAP